MKATRDWFGETLVNIGKEHDNVVVVSCDLSSATKISQFKKVFPSRFFECGIAEANAIGIAAGLAQEGFRPFLAGFSHFLTGKFLEIFQSIGLNNTGVVLVGTHVGLAIGKDGPTQMGLRDIALLRTLPNVDILHPVDGIETDQVLRFIISNNRPTYLRLCRQPLQEVHDSSYQFNFGKPDILLYGEDVVIFSMGGTIPVLMNCLTLFEKKGIRPTIVNISSLPCCIESVIDLIRPIKKVFVVEDHFVKGGLFDEIARIAIEIKEVVSVKGLGVPNYGQSGDPKDLYRLYNLDEDGIVSQVQKFLKKI